VVKKKTNKKTQLLMQLPTDGAGTDSRVVKLTMTVFLQQGFVDSSANLDTIVSS
jgi:hypothetical protein